MSVINHSGCIKRLAYPLSSFLPFLPILKILTDGRPVAPLGVGAVFEVLDEHAGEAEGDVVVLGARQDRREALLVRGGEVGAAAQQQLRRLDQAAGRRQVQRTALLVD